MYLAIRDPLISNCTFLWESVALIDQSFLNQLFQFKPRPRCLEKVP